MKNSQQIRVLYVITKSVWGGAQKYVYDLATSLPQDQFEVLVALGENGQLAQKLQTAGISTYAVRNFKKSINPWREVRAFFEILKLYRTWHPDIIHSNSSKAGGIAGAAAFFYKRANPRVKTVFTVHGWAFNEPRPSWLLFLIRLASKATCFFQDSIICISSDIKAKTQKLTGNLSKAVFIPNGIEDTRFLPRAEAQQALLGQPREFVIGTIAEWTTNKGLTVLVEAFAHTLKEFPQAVLCLIGWGDKEEEIRHYTQRLGIQESVHMITLSPAAPYLKAFDIFVLPSYKEGLPYVLLEASLAELPIIATRVGGIPDIIEDTKNGLLVPPGSSIEIMKKLFSFKTNPGLGQQLGVEARKRALAHFGKTTMIEKTKNLYATLYSSRSENGLG